MISTFERYRVFGLEIFNDRDSESVFKKFLLHATRNIHVEMLNAAFTLQNRLKIIHNVNVNVMLM